MSKFGFEGSIDGKSTSGKNDLDDLFNYDTDGDDPFRNDYKSASTKEREKATERNSEIKDGLGIDEEIQLTRKPRAPRIKLDENLLLSAAGIPKLRSTAKNIQFRGKGHEYSDASKLLNFYQLWLDDLFPKAKFRDALAMVEKLGHKKRIQAMRMEWINEGNPNLQPYLDASASESQTQCIGVTAVEENSPETGEDVSKRIRDEKQSTPIREQPEEDIYSATPKTQTQRSKNTPEQSKIASEKLGTLVDEEPVDDELDALLAGFSAKPHHDLATTTVQNNDFEDDEEAMAEMDMEW
ncbi:unnamed protein product [Blumeria hordei]|uniref:Chromosome segregation in meiosis protein n=1 Tax=Blumeria hordei TaxID=2867405 RepID=A0A383UMX7_BLUHO|nr:unnamed protein product [Blumeria hordei]